MKTQNNQKGFIHVIVTLIVILVVLSLLGLNAEKIWTNVFYPLFAFLGNIIITVAQFLVAVIQQGWDALVRVGQ